MANAIKSWWQGELVFHDNDPRSSVVIIGPGSYRRHWTARALSSSLTYWRENHRWMIGIAIPSIIAISLALGRGH